MKRPRLGKELDQGHIEFPSCKGQYSRLILVIPGTGLTESLWAGGCWTTMPRRVDMQNLRVHPEEVACGNITWLHKKQSTNVLQCFFVTLATITIVSRKKCFSKPSEHRPCVRFHLPASSAPHPTPHTPQPAPRMSGSPGSPASRRAHLGEPGWFSPVESFAFREERCYIAARPLQRAALLTGRGGQGAWKDSASTA